MHNIEFLAGHEFYSYEFNFLRGFRTDLVAEGINELINFVTTTALSSHTNTYRLEGFLSRLNYNFDGKYFLSGSFRRDGSSRFYRENRWGNFFSIGTAWRIDKENFMAGIAWIDMLRFRASYGQVGNDNLGTDLRGFYPWMPLHVLGFNNALEPGIIQNKLASYDLKWESVNSWSTALEFGLFNRIVGTIEYFHRSNVDQLFEVPLPPSSGTLSELQNAGTHTNSGIEFRLATDIIHSRDFVWNLDVNFSHLKNEITKLPQEEIIVGAHKLMVGRSVFDYWLRQYHGVDPADGAVLYKWDNTLPPTGIRVFGNDTLTTSHVVALWDYSGSAIPDIYGGFTNTFRYRNFELSAVVSWQIGGLVYDVNYAALMSSGNHGGAYHIDILNRWQRPGDITNVPRLDVAQVAAFGAASTRWLIDASFLNIRSVNLFYNLPQSLAQRMAMQNVRLYVSAENLAFFSKRKGMEPQQSFGGVTGNFYSPARTVTFGINLSF